MKKLKLKKETISLLNDDKLSELIGGVGKITQVGANNCPTNLKNCPHEGFGSDRAGCSDFTRYVNCG